MCASKRAIAGVVPSNPNERVRRVQPHMLAEHRTCAGLNCARGAVLKYSGVGVQLMMMALFFFVLCTEQPFSVSPQTLRRPVSNVSSSHLCSFLINQVIRFKGGQTHSGQYAGLPIDDVPLGARMLAAMANCGRRRRECFSFSSAYFNNISFFIKTMRLALFMGGWVMTGDDDRLLFTV